VVPFINNDAWVGGHNAPGTGVGQVDLYGHDLYPLDFDCNDMLWEKGSLREGQYAMHLNISPSTPYALPEFQGGTFDIWGGTGFSRCLERFNQEQTRVYYKNNFAAGAKIFNVYMVWLAGSGLKNVAKRSRFTGEPTGATWAMTSDTPLLTMLLYELLWPGISFLLTTAGHRRRPYHRPREVLRAQTPGQLLQGLARISRGHP
jgi:hypothetical protein